MLNGINIHSQQNQNHRNYKYKRLSRSDSEGDQDEAQEKLELLNRGANRTKSDGPTKFFEYDTLFERPIHEGESLASISLKYRISVADLKRVNKLHKEAEFYALNSLKIPVKNNSVLYEVLQEEQNENKIFKGDSSVPSGHRVSTSSDWDSEVDAMPVGVISISQICREKKTRREARHFLENMHKDLQRLQEKTNSYKSSLDEAAASLTTVTFSPMEKSLFGCSERDFSWWKVLGIGCAIVVGVPFTYLLITLLKKSD